MTKEVMEEATEKWCWPDFYRRLKRREVTRSDLNALTFRVTIPLISPSLAPIFLQTEGAIGDWFTNIAYPWVASLFIILCGLLSYCMSVPNSFFQKFLRIISPVLYGLLLGHLSIGYFTITNALAGDKKPEIVSGPIVGKASSSGRMGSSTYLHLLYQGRKIRLSVPLREWKSYNIGDMYSITMYRGGLGYFYRWKWSGI